MKRLWRENNLSIVMGGLFFVAFLFGQAWTGFLVSNEERSEHGRRPQRLTEYLLGAHFAEATMENWESEFLQAGAFILATAWLYQKGSAESKDPDKREAVDRDPRKVRDKSKAPWPVRRDGWILRLYENSLVIAFFSLFLVSFFLHACAGRAEYNQDQSWHGGAPISVLGYMGSSQFWFESFQNWQSEFLAIACMVIFTIWLRQRGSPESKPVDAPHSETGK